MQRCSRCILQPQPTGQPNYFTPGDGAISSLDVKPLKLVDQIIYLGSNISSTENRCLLLKHVLIFGRFSKIIRKTS